MNKEASFHFFPTLISGQKRLETRMNRLFSLIPLIPLIVWLIDRLNVCVCVGVCVIFYICIHTHTREIRKEGVRTNRHAVLHTPNMMGKKWELGKEGEFA